MLTNRENAMLFFERWLLDNTLLFCEVKDTSRMKGGLGRLTSVSAEALRFRLEGTTKGFEVSLADANFALGPRRSFPESGKESLRGLAVVFLGPGGREETVVFFEVIDSKSKAKKRKS